MGENYNPLEDLAPEPRYKKFLIDVTRDVKEPAYLMKYKGVGFSPVGNIHAIKAKAKNGKTQLTKIFIAACISGSYMGIECTKNDCKVLYVDTEMGEDITTLAMQSALRMCGKTDPRFKPKEPCNRLISATLRTEETGYRWDDIIALIEDFSPDLVIIDGLRDLIFDFNDIEQSNDIILKLLKVSEEKNCAIWNILHVNKNDENMRGHLGTELVNKSFEVQQVKKVEKFGETVFEVEQTESRWKPIDSFTFCMDEYGSPCAPAMGTSALEVLSNEMKMSYNDLWSRHSSSIGEDGRYTVSLRRPDFIDSVMKILNIKKTAAYERVKTAESQGIITYDSVMHQTIFNDIFRGKNTEMPF